MLEYCLDIVPGYSLDLVKPMAHEQNDVIDPTFSGGGGIFSCFMRTCEDLLRIIPAFYTEKKRFNFDNPVAKHCDFTSSMKSLGNSFAHLRDCRFPFCAGHKRFLGLFVSFFFFTFTLFIKIPLGLVLISPNSWCYACASS